MHGATGVAPDIAGSTGTTHETATVFSLGGVCRSVGNIVGTLVSNHRLPTSGQEACRQVMSNLRNFLDVYIAANPKGIETPSLAAAYIVIEWLFWQQQHQTTRQRLARTTSDNQRLNAYFSRLNSLAFAVPAARGLEQINRYIAKCEKWRSSLSAEEYQQAREFEEILTACLEKRRFWQPQPSLLRPLVKWVAPYIGIYLGETLAACTPTTSARETGQTLYASPSLLTENADDEMVFFEQGKDILNVPGTLSLPQLILTPRQEYCTELPLCATDLPHHLANQTAGYEIEGLASPGNEVLRFCINNKSLRQLFINRELTTIRTPFPSRIYLHPLMLSDSSTADIGMGVCPEPTDGPCAAIPSPPVFLPQPDEILNRLYNPGSKWGLPNVFAAEMTDHLDYGEPYIDEDSFRHFGESTPPATVKKDIPFRHPFETQVLLEQYRPLSPQEVRAGNPEASRPWAERSEVLTSAPSLPKSQRELISYEVNIVNYDRSKRIIPLERNPFMRRITTTRPHSSLAPTIATPDPLTRLFGPSEQTKLPGTCRSAPPTLIARDLDVMVDRAEQWLRYIPSTLIDEKIHRYFLTLDGVAAEALTSLEEIVVVARKLVTGLDSQYAYDELTARDFAALIFEGSSYTESPELVTAWLRSSAGKGWLADILLNAIDRAIPDPGILLAGSVKTVEQRVASNNTRFAALTGLKVELQNQFKSNLVASVYYARGAQPDFIQHHAITGKLQFLHLEWIKKQYPCFRVCNKPDVDNHIVLSPRGVLLTIAAGMIADDEKLHHIPARKLERFGKQAMLRLSDDFVLSSFARFDHLLAKSGHNLSDYLQHFEEEGELLVNALYLNLRIAHQLLQGAKQNQQLRSDYQELAAVEKQLCSLVLGQVTAADQAIFLNAARQPQGLEIRFISAESPAAGSKQCHYIGFTLTANHQASVRCNTLSVIPMINDIVADVVFDDSTHCQQPHEYLQWINQQGKATLLSRLSEQQHAPLSDVTFILSDKTAAPTIGSEENWSSYLQKLSTIIINQRFPAAATTTTTPAPGPIGEVTEIAGNLLANFIPIKTCREAFDAVRSRPETVEEALITAEYVALCVYELVPEGENSLVNEVGYALHSVAEKITGLFREKSQRARQATANPLDASRIQPQLFLEDSQVTGHLARSPQFHDYLRWMLRDKTLKLRPLPAQVKILEVRWNIITDQMYCKANTPYGVKNYRVDEQNALLIPGHHQFTDGWTNSQELVVDADAFVSHAGSGTLDSLKTERMEQDMRESHRYGDVLFKNDIKEIDFSNGNVRETFFSNLNIYSPWQPIGLWVKKDVADFIVIGFKDDKDKIHYKQLSQRDNALIDWYGDPVRNKRGARAATTPAPDCINLFTPLLYNYQEVNQYNDAQRAADMMALIYLGSQIPDLNHRAESRCRKMVEELIKLAPFSFIKEKFPVAANFVEKFSHWEVPVRINDGFNQFVDAVGQFKREHHQESVFYAAATSIIKEFEELDTKNKLIYEANKKFNRMAKDYFKKHIEKNIIINSRLNRMNDESQNPGIKDAHQFILKTNNLIELKTKYPDYYADITRTLREVHDIANTVEKLLNSSHATTAVREVYQLFTGNSFTDKQVSSIVADYKNYMNELKSITPERIRLFEERYTGDGRLAYGCLNTEVERLLYGAGNVGFVLTGDKKKLIYLQRVSHPEANKIVFPHEGRHLANKDNVIFTPAEFYAETDNPVVKFSLSGIAHFSQGLLSNRYQMVDYLMRNHEFLRNFFRQVNIFLPNSPLKRNMITFTNKFLGMHAWLYSENNHAATEDKRKALTKLVMEVFKNNELVEYLIAHNADFSAGVLDQLLAKAYQCLELKKEERDDSDPISEQLKSLLLQAGAINTTEVNFAASTSQATGHTLV